MTAIEYEEKAIEIYRFIKGEGSLEVFIAY
jgi:hypothetical protein